MAWICCTLLSWSWTAELSPPKSASPQLTTDPSSRIAAKAFRVAWICSTPFSWSRTAELSPPECGYPQVTTDPSSRIAANAPIVAWMCCTPLSWSRTADMWPPKAGSPQVTIALSPWHHKAKAPRVAASCGWSTRAVRHSPSSTSASKVLSGSTRTRFLAVISLSSFFPKARLAFICTSWTVEEGRSVRSSACPFGKATFTWIIWDVLKTLTALQDIWNHLEWISTSHFEPEPSWILLQLRMLTAWTDEIMISLWTARIEADVIHE